jgi:hypothetical protein
VFQSVRSYFRTHLNALKFNEWKDAFNVENIPSTIISGSYHISAPQGSRRDAYDPTSQDVEAEVVIRIARKGLKTPADAIDQCTKDLDAILARVLLASNRLGCDLKNIYYEGHSIDQLSATNDNVAVLEITFRCLIILSV